MDISEVEKSVAKILGRAKKSNIAVFDVDGEVRGVPHPGKQFDTMTKDFPLCGVYNAEATVEMVLEDVYYGS